jgi:hypothetical protein
VEEIQPSAIFLQNNRSYYWCCIVLPYRKHIIGKYGRSFGIDIAHIHFCDTLGGTYLFQEYFARFQTCFEKLIIENNAQIEKITSIPDVLHYLFSVSFFALKQRKVANCIHWMLTQF